MSLSLSRFHTAFRKKTPAVLAVTLGVKMGYKTCYEACQAFIAVLILVYFYDSVT
jgi:hypothetical protein